MLPAKQIHGVRNVMAVLRCEWVRLHFPFDREWKPLVEFF